MTPAVRPKALAAEWWLVALLASVFVLFLVADRTTRRTDTFVYDLLLGLERREPDPRIFLVTIDSRSLNEVGPWPWPRDVQARLIEAVGAARPRAIAYDVLLLEPTEAAADAALAHAIGGARPVFLPLLLESPGLNGARYQESLPIPPIASEAAGLGHISLIADPDGVFRRIRLWDGGPARPRAHLMELLRRVAEPAKIPAAGDPSAPPLLVPFSGPPGNFPSVGAAAVLRGEVPAEFLRDRLVIVGAAAEGLGDRYPTSHGRGGAIMSGVEIQGNILDGLLSGRMIGEAGFAIKAALALTPLWILLIGFRTMRPRATAWLLGLLVLATLAASAAGLLLMRVWIPPLAAIIGLAVVYPLWGWRRLAALSGQMLRQLEQLGAERDALTQDAAPVRGLDPVSRQAVLLDAAIARMQTLRRFVSESLHQLPDAILVLDGEGRLRLANAAAQSLLAGLSITGERPHIGALFDRFEPDREAPTGLLGWPPAGSETSGGVRAQDGRHFELDIAPRTGADGAQLGWLVKLSDDTEVWLSRHQREEMMHFLSHDMRSPQASILAVLATAGEPEIKAEIAERIEGYARRTLSLADGIVQLARAETLQYRPEPVDLADVLMDAVDDLWPQITARGINLATEGEQEDWMVRGERSLLARAVLNLIDNAIKFSPEGSTIRCVLAEQQRDGRRMATCAVTDEGSGIAEDQLCTLFERFKRAGGDARQADGTGLGLAFVQTVAARHGGRIDCVSEPGKGSTFTLAIPMVDG